MFHVLVQHTGDPTLVNTLYASLAAASLLLAAGLAPRHTTHASAAATARFQAPSFVSAGAGPVAVTAADFNHDGLSDLAVANRAANTVSVLLARGNDAFSAPVSYAVGSGPVALAAGDLTGHGTADLVVADNYDATISVLMGNGNGTFRPAGRYRVPLGPQSIALLLGAEEFVQRTAFHIVHDDVETALFFEGVPHARDRRMVQLTQNFPFAQEPGLRFVKFARGEHHGHQFLDGPALAAEAAILNLVHGAEGSAADQSIDDIAGL